MGARPDSAPGAAGYDSGTDQLTRMVPSDGMPGVAKVRKGKGGKGGKGGKKRRASSKTPAGAPAAEETLTAEGPPPVYFADPGGFNIGACTPR